MIGSGPDLPFCRLSLQQLRQDRDGGLEGGRSLFCEFGDGLRHAVHLQTPEHVVVDPAPGDAAQNPEGVVVRIKQHLVRLKGIGSHDKGTAVAQLEVRHL